MTVKWRLHCVGFHCDPHSVLCPSIPGDGIQKEGEVEAYGIVKAIRVVKCVAVKIKDFQETDQE